MAHFMYEDEQSQDDDCRNGVAEKSADSFYQGKFIPNSPDSPILAVVPAASAACVPLVWPAKPVFIPATPLLEQ
jgi:hypothetical protein